MTTEPTPHEPQKQNIVEQYVQAAGFGLPPEASRKVEKPLPNIVDEYVMRANFGLVKRHD